MLHPFALPLLMTARPVPYEVNTMGLPEEPPVEGVNVPEKVSPPRKETTSPALKLVPLTLPMVSHGAPVLVPEFPSEPAALT